MRGVSSLPHRVARLAAALPPPPPARHLPDYSRLTPDQRMRLAELIGRYEAVGDGGLTACELEEIAGLVGILDGEPES